MEVIPEKIYNRLHATTKKTGGEKMLKQVKKGIVVLLSAMMISIL